MALESYEGATPQVQAAPEMSTAGTQLAAQQMENLSARLQNFSDFKMKQHEMETVSKAEQDAYRDSVEGKPFHSESVTTAYGRAYNTVASATYASDANTAIEQKNAEYAQQFELDPVGYDKAMKEFVRSMSKNAPTPELQSVISINGHKVKNDMFGKLSIAENKRVRAAQSESFQQEFGRNINQVIELESTGRTADANLLKQKSLAHMRALVNEGVITDEEAQIFTKSAMFDVTLGVDKNSMAKLLSKPSLGAAMEFLKDKTEVRREDMDVDENDKYISELSSMLTKEQTRRKAAAKAQDEFSTQILKSYLDTVRDGGTSVLTTDQINYHLQNTSSKQTIFDVNAQRAIEKAIPDWREKSVVEMQDIAYALRDKAVTPAEQELLEQVEKKIVEKAQAVKNDVVGLSINSGDIPAPEYDISAAGGAGNLVSWLNNLNTSMIKEKYGDNATAVLPKQAAQTWIDYFEAPGNTTEKINTIGMIAELSPDKAQALYNQIGGKNSKTFSFLANLVVSDNKQAAEIALKGKNSGVKLDNSVFGTKFENSMNTLIGNVWSHDKSGTILPGRVEGLTNYNKGVVADGGDQLDASDALEKTFGSVETYNGKDIIIPRGVSKSDFDDWIDRLDVFVDNRLAKEIQSMNDTFGISKVQLHQAGNGKYRVYMTNGGKGYYVQQRNSKEPLILDYFKKAF